MVSMCAMRLKARGKYGTYSGTRVPNSANYVPNENCILLKYSILSNSDFSYWKIHVILHRQIGHYNTLIINILQEFTKTNHRIINLLYIN